MPSQIDLQPLYAVRNTKPFILSDNNQNKLDSDAYSVFYRIISKEEDEYNNGYYVQVMLSCSKEECINPISEMTDLIFKKEEKDKAAEFGMRLFRAFTDKELDFLQFDSGKIYTNKETEKTLRLWIRRQLA